MIAPGLPRTTSRESRSTGRTSGNTTMRCTWRYRKVEKVRGSMVAAQRSVYEFEEIVPYALYPYPRGAEALRLAYPDPALPLAAMLAVVIFWVMNGMNHVKIIRLI